MTTASLGEELPGLKLMSRRGVYPMGTTAFKLVDISLIWRRLGPARSTCARHTTLELVYLLISTQIVEGSSQLISCTVTLQPHPVMVLIIMFTMLIRELPAFII